MGTYQEALAEFKRKKGVGMSRMVKIEQHDGGYLVTMFRIDAFDQESFIVGAPADACDRICGFFATKEIEPVASRTPLIVPAAPGFDVEVPGSAHDFDVEVHH